MITVNCTLANKKYNMITLWSNFDDEMIKMTWSINRHNFAGKLNQDTVIFINNLNKYGVQENKDMNY